MLPSDKKLKKTRVKITDCQNLLVPGNTSISGDLCVEGKILGNLYDKNCDTFVTTQLNGDEDIIRMQAANAIVAKGVNGGTIAGTDIEGMGKKLMYHTTKSAFRSGTVDSTQWNESNIGNNSFASGSNTMANGNNSHAEGDNTLASGFASHAEGHDTVASGVDSHAEGNETIASGVNSHAEGNETIASGVNSHAEGNATIAAGLFSHAGGRESRTRLGGQWAQAAGKFTTEGDAQCSIYIMRRETTSTTTDELFIDGNNSRLEIPNNSAWVFDISLLALDCVTLSSDGWKICGIIQNANGTVSLEGVLNINTLNSNTLGTFAVIADNINNSLNIEITPKFNNKTRWTACIRTTESSC